MPIKLVISDFDGTQTDAEAEGKPFVDGYKDDLQKLTGLRENVLNEVVERCAAKLRAHPHRFGVKEDGILVAPANSDPYLRMQAIAQMIFDERGLLLDPTERNTVINELFEEHYPKTTTVFRPGADQLLEYLRWNAGIDVCIVTNARTHSVEAKLSKLPNHQDIAGIPLYGNAQKFMVGNEPMNIPVRFDILAGTVVDDTRWIYPRRTEYFKTLNAIRLKRRLEWEEIAVMGDILELDLVLPHLLGCHIILVANHNTPHYEMEWLMANCRGRARIFSNLHDVRMHLMRE